jgi:aspartate aminotransferase
MTLHGYTDNEGFMDVRQAVAENLNKRFGASYAGKNIVMTVGAACALNIIFKTILNPGDEVIVCCPYFSEYRGYISNHGGVHVEAKADFDTLQPDLADFASRFTERTRAVIVNTPNNPSGVVYTEETVQGLAKILKEKSKQYGHPIYLVSDEPYRELVYDGVKNPFLPDYYDDTLIAYSFSKSLSLPGERIGYVAVSDKADGAEELLAGLGLAIRTLGFVNAPSLIQKAVARCLDEKTDVAYYDENRKLIYQALTEYGFTCIKPNGAFYLMVQAPDKDSAAFVQAAKKYHILFVNGTGFGAPGYVRIAYCTSREKIERSLDGFKALAKEYFK